MIASVKNTLKKKKKKEYPPNYMKKLKNKKEW